jgi:branched-chain amino acid aminotransferase
VFERLRCYDGKIFKLEEYVQRFFRSARAIHIEMPIAHAEMKQAIKETVRANGFTNAHIKPIVTRGYAWEAGGIRSWMDDSLIAATIEEAAGR